MRFVVWAGDFSESPCPPPEPSPKPDGPLAWGTQTPPQQAEWLGSEKWLAKMALPRGSVVRGMELGCGPRDLGYDAHWVLSSWMSFKKSLSLTEPFSCCGKQKPFRGWKEIAGTWGKLVAFSSSWCWAGRFIRQGSQGSPCQIGPLGWALKRLRPLSHLGRSRTCCPACCLDPQEDRGSFFPNHRGCGRSCCLLGLPLGKWPHSVVL